MYVITKLILLLYLFLFVDFNNTQLFAKSNKINEKNKIKLLSWNIHMLEGPYGWLLKPNTRSINIIKSIKSFDAYDVILFQEAFSNTLRRKIYNGLKEIYPYQVEPNNKNKFYKSNSGLWIISQVPINLIDEISFSQSYGWDRFASKGAKLYSLTTPRTFCSGDEITGNPINVYSNNLFGIAN